MSTAKDRGYDIDLYRSTDKRWIAGVCGGIAENMQWSVMGVRICAVLLFMFTGAFAVLAYIAAVFLLASRSDSAANRRTQCDSSNGYHRNTNDFQQKSRPNLKQRMFDYGTSASSKLDEIRDRLAKVDQRIRAMEKHVTSRKFQFDREMRRGR
ncbi:PspC domain-containing protein [Neptunomonas antarctica]|uniref:Phage shock protein C (PspC) family protein n=1 Tax=Neptunomonas antarctica TaxID=619304 RepID=A0A1N7NQP4_9GAMM|nr:PspC domain-containing protein [Neptunomonas antarctica]SIT00654.1 phage shock protein C (PspC) family protein [Neptunomonas antarctica]